MAISSFIHIDEKYPTMATTPNTRSTKDIIVRNTYVTGNDDNELKKAENCLLYIDAAVQSIEDVNNYIADLDHLGIGNTIKEFKPAIISMGFDTLYSAATALENEFLNQIISHPRPNLEDFLVEVAQSVENANTQLTNMRVSLI